MLSDYYNTYLRHNSHSYGLTTRRYCIFYRHYAEACQYLLAIYFLAEPRPKEDYCETPNPVQHFPTVNYGVEP